MPAATETLRLPVLPVIGNRSWSEYLRATPSEIPVPSSPMTSRRAVRLVGVNGFLGFFIKGDAGHALGLNAIQRASHIGHTRDGQPKQVLEDDLMASS